MRVFGNARKDEQHPIKKKLLTMVMVTETTTLTFLCSRIQFAALSTDARRWRWLMILASIAFRTATPWTLLDENQSKFNGHSSLPGAQLTSSKIDYSCYTHVSESLNTSATNTVVRYHWLVVAIAAVAVAIAYTQTHQTHMADFRSKEVKNF